jgi:hypothetical protein
MKAFTLLAKTIGLALALVPALTQATIYVTKQGSDANSGTDWAHAKASIQTAIDDSNPGDQIWVGKGTYTESVTLDDNRKLFGSFAGTETSPSQRNMTANPTIFVQGDELSMFVPSICTSATTVDGFVFNSVGTAADPLLDTDIECWGSPTFSNCLVTGMSHTAYAPVRIIDGKPLFQSCTFSGNHLVGSLGGNSIYLVEVWSAAAFYQCKFADNISNGLYVVGPTSFTLCSMTQNTPLLNGTFIQSSGAGSTLFLSCVVGPNPSNIVVNARHAPITAKNTLFQNNSNPPNQTNSGPCLSATDADIDIESCTFSHNSIGFNCSGRLFITDSLMLNNSLSGGTAEGSSTVQRCVFSGNGSLQGGSALLIDSYDPTQLCLVKDCLFTANTCETTGAAITLAGYVTVANCTFVGNKAGADGKGGTIVMVNGVPSATNQAFIANNIFLGNSSGVLGLNGNIPGLDHNDFFGDAQYEYMDIPPGATDIHVDPKFFNPANGDCHLAAGSPAIGTGVTSYVAANDKDLDGINRLTGIKVSLGAYEPYAMSITGLTINSPVVGGFNAVAYVTLTSPAYYGLMVAFVESGVSGALSLPFPTGATSANFDIPTTPVTANTNITVTVVYGASSKSATLTVTPAKILSVVLPTAGVVGGNPGTGTLNFNGPVSASASTTLSSSSASLVVPSSLAGSGAASQTFTFTTTGVVAPQSVTVTATYNGVVVHGTVSLLPASLKLILLSAKAVKGGGRLAGYPYLDGFAAGSGAVLSLSSSNPSVLTVPASFTIPAGKSNSSFLIQTSTVTKITVVNLTGSYHGVQVTVPVEVDP